jgi:hypothetical protein
MEIIHIASAAITLLSAMVPIYFIIKVSYNRKVFFSSILLFTVLMSYGVHAILESIWQNNFELIRICFMVSITGTLITYLAFRKKQTTFPISGVFGIALLLVFCIWISSETIRLFIPSYAIEATYFVSLAMIGFGILLLVKFFWLRYQYPTLTHN